WSRQPQGLPVKFSLSFSAPSGHRPLATRRPSADSRSAQRLSAGVRCWLAAALLAAWPLVSGAAPVAGRADAGTSEPPSDAECPTLPPIRGPLAFTAGEQLEFEMDALGALAGRLRMRVLPQKDGTLPVEVSVQTSTFFSKIRRVKGLATSYL